MEMDAFEFINVIQKSHEKDAEEFLMQQYNVLLPMMIRKEIKYESLEKYMDERMKKNVDNRPVDDIIEEIEKAHRRAGMEM